MFTAFLCKLVCRMVFFASWSFSIPVTTWSVLFECKARYGEWVESGWDVLSILSWICRHQSSTYAIYDSWTTMIEARLALPLRLRVDDLGNLNVTWVLDHLPSTQRWMALNDCSLSRSFWTACFCGWSVILRISWRMLRFSERFTASSGMPETLKSTFASSIARSNLSTLSRLLRWSFLALCAVPPLFQVSLSCRGLGHVVLPSTQVSPVYRKNFVFLATHQQSLELRVSPNDLHWFLGDWVGLEEPTWTVSPSDCWTSFPDWSMFNCGAQIIVPSGPIEIVPQRDLRWWTRRQILPFIQWFSAFQSFSSQNATWWKYTLKDNCIRSCLIEL